MKLTKILTPETEIGRYAVFVATLIMWYTFYGNRAIGF